MSAGLLLSSQFPVNYFSISEVEQFYPAFADEYAKIGDRRLEGEGKFWRFNRIHDYANKARPPTCLKSHVKPGLKRIRCQIGNFPLQGEGQILRISCIHDSAK